MSSSTKEKILNVAGPVFAEKGFQRTTVRELCEKASVNVASINYYFGDKQNLYSEVIRQAHRRCEAQHPLPSWGEEIGAEERLKDLILALLKQLSVAETAPWEVQLLMREVLTPSRNGSEVAEEYFSPFFRSLLDIIDSLSPHQLTYEQLSEIGMSVLSQCLIYRYGQKTIASLAPSIMFAGGKPHVEHLAEQITKFSLGGIQAAPVQRPAVTAAPAMNHAAQASGTQVSNGGLASGQIPVNPRTAAHSVANPVGVGREVPAAQMQQPEMNRHNDHSQSNPAGSNPAGFSNQFMR